MNVTLLLRSTLIMFYLTKFLSREIGVLHKSSLSSWWEGAEREGSTREWSCWMGTAVAPAKIVVAWIVSLCWMGVTVAKAFDEPILFGLSFDFHPCFVFCECSGSFPLSTSYSKVLRGCNQRHDVILWPIILQWVQKSARPSYSIATGKS